MKFSEAMLKGYQTNGGRQTKGTWVDGDGAMCVMGAVRKGLGCKDRSASAYVLADGFSDVWGESAQNLNDAGLDWMDIYGMAVAAGL